jgi:hypothetical protein
MISPDLGKISQFQMYELSKYCACVSRNHKYDGERAAQRYAREGILVAGMR